jgi:hypothetical protein
MVEPVDVQDLIDKTLMEFKPATQFCYRVPIRSFLSHNGYGLPKTNLQYVPQAWHRGYKRVEIHALLGCLRKKHHMLFVVMAAQACPARAIASVNLRRLLFATKIRLSVPARTIIV